MLKWLKQLFNSFVGVFKELLKEALPLWKQIVIGQLSTFAKLVVTELDYTTLTNEQKRSEAFKRLKEYAEKNAIDVKDSLINVTIELALQRLKG